MMYGWERYLAIEKDFLKVKQYVPYELKTVYSEFFTRQVVLLGAEIEAAMKTLCRQSEPSKPHGNIGQIKDVVLNKYPRIVTWKCIIKSTEFEVVPFEKWDSEKLGWWDVYTNIKHNLVDTDATYEVVLKMLGAYEQLLLLIEATDPNRIAVVSSDKAISGALWNEAVDGGIKAYTIIEMPELLVPDIIFAIGNGVNGLPGIAFYPENVLEKVVVNV